MQIPAGAGITGREMMVSMGKGVLDSRFHENDSPVIIIYQAPPTVPLMVW